MISSQIAQVISLLPTKIAIMVSKTIIDKYINKYANIEIKGIENLKNISSPILFVCNHLSNSDGLILNKILKDYNITFVAGVKLSNNPMTKLGTHVVKTITINPNSADKESISSIIKTLKNKNNVLIFPEGTRSRDGKMIKAKNGVLLIQKLSKTPVVPIGITGTEKLLSINDKDMKSEKFDYADVKISIGTPITMPERSKDENKQEYEEKAINILMKSIADLLPEQYRGVYR